MIVFWLICTGLVAIALAFILPTLLERAPTLRSEKERQAANLDVYRDQLAELEADLRNGVISQEQYQQDREDIERRLLDDVPTLDQKSKKAPQQASRAAVYAIAVGIPAIAVTLYLVIGNYSALSGAPTRNNQPSSPAGAAAGDGEMSQQQIEANVATLAKRLEQNPGDADGWAMLGRSYMSLDKFGDASNAYAKAVALKPDDVNLLVNSAFALAMANGRQLQGEPFELVKKALRLDPQNVKALELAGSAEFQAKNYKQAVDYWQKALEKAPAGSELALTISKNINEAKALAGTSSK